MKIVSPKKDPKDVHYLALEGGGGKGVAYVGAIRALENQKVLPIDINQPGQNQIKGISASSAGATTAMMLAMGVGSAELEKMLEEGEKTFIGFFDRPAPGWYRSVSIDNKQSILEDDPSRTSIPEQVVQGLLEQGLDVIVRKVLEELTSGSTNNPIALQLISHPLPYLHNLIFDRGLFPGFAVRRFLSEMISEYLSEKILEYRGDKRFGWTEGGKTVYFTDGDRRVHWTEAGNLNFEQFYSITGVDLVITGTNITKHRPGVFSKELTPHFPVAEAVGISMNIPLLFKPVYVWAFVKPVGPLKRVDDYHGFWVDGGMLNNFPLHAFDRLQKPCSDEYPDLRPLHPNMLGLRLTGEAKPTPASPGIFSVLLGHLGDLMDTLLYPSEEGQIRTPDEVNHTIEICTYDVETTDFAPSKDKRDILIKEAESAVNLYFGIGG